ncbi:NAD(P)H-dependent oxidoreductase [Mycobacterium intracellulare]|uniref:NADPH-dependent FMN reductase n=1 Tax=Mycobacterium intracellulare TaxID=1767 RepID=UPI001CD967CA|nr:NADPH-dependent FMN reductase [Mycobacterium intracellulare]MCA2276748.1 NAD(P)H-dependent oxidoreductase [Mycobacterium intracellulare]MCA2328453.1 NAD(P)H-dependent oxidoreductase [Mycobacterium intracellulare]
MTSTAAHHVALLVGSLRRESINRKLANAIVDLAPPGLKFFEVPVGDLPIYNGDLEEDRPAAVRRFTDEIRKAEAIFVVMPEFNRSLPAVLKNAIDWGSKPIGQNVWLDKPVAMTGTSPGAIGTAVGQQHLRQILGVLGASVLGGEAYISFKPGLIGPDGKITDPSTEQFLKTYLERFASFADKLLG